jgi:surface protein
MADKFEINNETYNMNKLTGEIKEVMSNICRFEYTIENKLTTGTGFLCKIDYLNNTKMPVLITCYHLLDDTFFSKYKIINFSYYLDNKELHKTIALNNQRIIYKNKDLDITIIEIKEEDNLDIFSFLEIDNSINIDNPQYNNIKIYLLHYPLGLEEVHISKGNITNLEKNDINIFKTDYSSYEGSSGAPVLNYNNNLVIGIHNAGNRNEQNFGRGLFIKRGINKFLEEMSKKPNQAYNSPYSFIDTIDIIYQMPSSDKIKLFGPEFVSHNKDNCKIIHNGIESPIVEFYFLSYEDIQNDDFRIKLKGINLVNDLSYMFRKCKYLKELPNISRIDTSNITNMRVMLEGCEYLEKLPNLKQWNVANVISMEGMFYNCINLQKILGIEKWNPINLQNCYEMFYGCKSLWPSETSKIEKWQNVAADIRKLALKGYKFDAETIKAIYCLTDNFNGTVEFLMNNFGNILANPFYDY